MSICIKTFWIPPGGTKEVPMAKLYMDLWPEDIDSYIDCIGATRYEILDENDYTPAD